MSLILNKLADLMKPGFKYLPYFQEVVSKVSTVCILNFKCVSFSTEKQITCSSYSKLNEKTLDVYCWNANQIYKTKR